MSLYPQDQDRFADYVAGVDQLVADDLNDALGAVRAIQDELGLDPSGKFGSIYSRIFATRNVSLASGWWRPLSWRSLATSGAAFSRQGQGLVHRWKQGSMEGRTTAFGDGIPACFGALQTPLLGGPGVPWRSFLAAADAGSGTWAARDRDNQDLNTANTQPCTFGVLCWNLLT